jgi:flagellar hook assembly protein FlgD
MASIPGVSAYAAQSQAGAAVQQDEAATEAAANKEMFLKLLVAQLQHQDPASPEDPVQFLTQLAQFTTLEQTISMRQELESIHEVLVEANTPAPAADSSEE